MFKSLSCFWSSESATPVAMGEGELSPNGISILVVDSFVTAISDQRYMVGIGCDEIYSNHAEAFNPNWNYGTTNETHILFPPNPWPPSAYQNGGTATLPSMETNCWATGAGGATNWCGGAYTSGSTEYPVINGTMYTASAYTNINLNAINDTNIAVGYLWTNYIGTAVMVKPLSGTALSVTYLGPGRASYLNNQTNASGAPAPQIIGGDTNNIPMLWDQTTPSGSPAIKPRTGNYVGKTLTSLLNNTNNWSMTSVSGINNLSSIIGTATYTQTGPTDPIPAGVHGAMLISAELAVDANRDGTIVMANDTGNPANAGLPVDTTSQTKPFTFWVNDGVDGYSPDPGESTVQEDLAPGTFAPNCQIGEVTCSRDLENFARLWLYTKGLNTAISGRKIIVGLEWHSNTGNATTGWGTNDGSPSINIYEAAPKHGSSTVTGGTDYLTDPNTASDQAGLYGSTIGTVAKGQPYYFDPSTFSGLTDANPKTYFLFEAAARGTGRLVVTFNTVSGGTYTKIGEGGSVYMNLKETQELYERWTVGDGPVPGTLTAGGGGAPSSPATICQLRLPTGATALQYSPTTPGLSVPSDPTGNDYILYVHGWNMAPWEKDAFAATMLKRLYWQGYKGKFGAFQWPTTYTTSVLQDGIAYDDGEYSAWQSAVPLEGLLSQLNGNYGGHVFVLGHSMGNIVSGEALRIAGQAGQSLVNTYVATQAAVPGHCYDPTLTGTDLLNFNLSYGLITDHRGPFTPNIYNNWMMPTTPGATAKANFFNVNDFALSTYIWQLDQVLKPDQRLTLGGWNYNYNTYTQPLTVIQDNFYKDSVLSEVNLHLGTVTAVQDRYEIMAYASQPYSKALGGVTDAAGFGQQNLQNLFPTDTYPPFSYSAHPWHSAEFLFTNPDMQNYWSTLLGDFGLPTTTTPP